MDLDLFFIVANHLRADSCSATLKLYNQERVMNVIYSLRLAREKCSIPILTLMGSHPRGCGSPQKTQTLNKYDVIIAS